MMNAYEKYRSLILNGARKKSEHDIDMQRRIINSSLPVIGCATPYIKSLAKAVPLSERDEVLDGFYAEQEHYYDTVLFASCLAAKKGSYDDTVRHLKRIIPLYSSWAHVDSTIPLLRWTDRDSFLSDFAYLTASENQYEVRTYIIYMMSCCMTDERIDFVLKKAQELPFGQYYIDMGAAWLFAEGLTKFYDKTVKVIESKSLPPFVHNKAIQKARESFRITPQVKAYLNSLKIK